MPVRVSCPYCNAAVTLAAYPPAGRAACPRCGDAFPVRPPSDEDQEAGGRRQEAAEAGPEPDPVGPPPSALRPPPSKWRVSALRATVVAVGMGLVGLAVGLVFLQRAGSGPADPEPAAAAPDGVTPPDRLAGLNLLPPGTNLAAAVQPGPVLAYAARTGKDARGLLAEAGLPPAVFAALDRAGVTLPQIDHVAVGVPLSDTAAELPPRFAAALLLKRPLDDEDKFLAALEARRYTKAGRTLYKGTLGGLPVVLAQHAPRAWLVAGDERELDTTGAGMPAAFREMVGQRLAPDSAAWVAAADSDWAAKPTVRLAATAKLLPPAWAPLVAKGRAAAAGLSFGEAPRARLFVQCVDGPTAADLRAYFQRRAGDDARTGGAGPWALFDAPFDPADGVRSLRGLLSAGP